MIYTSGDWATEPESCAALDEVLNAIKAFKVHHEVRGHYLQPRLGQKPCTPRIDRILIPNATLLSRGWPYGPIGIECKRSGTNIGPPLSQLLDYSRAAWQIKQGFWITLEWVFLWPLESVGGGPLLSVFSQNRIGMASTSRYTALQLNCDQNLATFSWNDTVRIGAGLNGAGRNGTKAGSR